MFKQMSCNYYKVAVVLLGVCFLSYGVGLLGGYMIDDHSFLSGKYAAPFDTLGSYFSKTIHQHYSPIYYLVNVQLFRCAGDNPLLLHCVNIFLLFFNSFALYVFLRYLFSDALLAFIASLIMCMHPINSFSVNLISLNFIFIYAIFMLMSLQFYLAAIKGKTRNWIYYGMSLVFFIASLLTFEAAVLFPLYLGVLLLFVRRWKLKNVLIELVSVVVIAVLYLWRWYAVVGARGDIIARIQFLNISFWEYLASFSYLCLWYVSKLFIPINIIFMKNIEPVREYLWMWNVGFLAMLIAWIMMGVVLKKRGIKFFAIVWLSVGFVLFILSIFSHCYMGLVIEPHWFHFSSMGFYVFVAAGLVDLKKKINPKLWMAVICALFSTLFIITQRHNLIKISEEEYCRYWNKMSPGNTFAQKCLAKYLVEDGKHQEALHYYQKMIKRTEMFPDYRADILNQMGVVYLLEGKKSMAVEAFLQSVSLDPTNPQGHVNLGKYFTNEEHFDVAQKYFTKALAIDPTNPQLKRYLSKLHQIMGEKK